MSRTTAVLVMAAALIGAPVAAQERPAGAPADTSRRAGHMQPGMMQPGMPGGMTGMMQAMHGQGGMMGMAAGPAMVLRLRESLELTDAQVERLEALRDTAQSQARQHMAQGMQAMHSAGERLSTASPDLEAYEAQLREAAEHIILAHTVMARAAVRAREVLTPEQLQRVDLARKMMQELQQGMMESPMPPGGMPGPGGAGQGHDH